MIASRTIFDIARTTAFLWLAVTLSSGPTAAQSLNFGGDGSEQPIEIFADEGIEWQQENLLFLARGNARAVRGKVTVHGDLRRAFYQENKTPNSGTEIQRLEAEGNVRIISPGEAVYGEKAVFNLDNSVLVISGGNLRLVAGDDVLTADGQLEYWETKQMAVARGNAAVVREDKKLYAEVLAAYFQRDKSGKSSIHRVEAFDNVKIVTATETATADRGVYNARSGIATLLGTVKIVRGNNILNGCKAEVNLNKGVSKLFGCGNQVSGVIRPNDKKKEKKKK